MGIESIKDMRVGRIYRLTRRGTAYNADTDGWLWLWEGKDDGHHPTSIVYPVLKSVATGAEEEFDPELLEEVE